MAVTQEFKQAVLQNNNLKTKIMLKDSLLVDTSFNQFDEMLRYAESKLMEFWVKDEEDDEILSDDPQEFDVILAGLVNNFSHKRVNHLKKMISTMYPRKVGKKLPLVKKKRFVIRQTDGVQQECKRITNSSTDILNVVSQIDEKKYMDDKDIAKIIKAAKSIIKHCDKITGSRCKNGNNK